MNRRWANEARIALLMVCVAPGATLVAQQAQTEQPAAPVHLYTGRKAPMKVTIENKCPQQQSFKVTTEGLPANLIQPSPEIAIAGGSTTDTELTVDTTNVAAGLYSGQITATCTTCGTVCAQDRANFPVQFQIDDANSPTTPAEGPTTTNPTGGNGPLYQEVPPKPGQGQPGGGQAAGGETPRKPPGQGKPQDQGPGAAPGPGSNKPRGDNGPQTPPNGGQNPNGGGSGPGTTTDTPPAQPQNAAKAPCPCVTICSAAVAAEQKAETARQKFVAAQDAVNQALTRKGQLQQTIAKDQAQLSQIAKASGNSAEEQRLNDEIAKSNTEIAGLNIKDLTGDAWVAERAYSEAASEAGTARLNCDDCLALHPECPQSIRAPGDTTENPPPTNPPGPSTASGGGGTTPPPTQEKPKQPPGTTPGNNPDGHTPPKNPTTGGGGNGYGHNETAQCPELHHGCIALVIDFHSYDWASIADTRKRLREKLDNATTPSDKQDLQQRWQFGSPVEFVSLLKSADCTVFSPNPVKLKKIEANATPEVRNQLTADNKTEMARVNKVIDAYRSAVEKGKPEIAIEVVTGHGSPSYFNASSTQPTARRCGDVGPGYEVGVSTLYRAGFFEGNYKAANENVCGWFNMDFSCYGGLTPKVVDELENFSSSTCQKASAINCPLHAGWSGDGSMASATAITTCVETESDEKENLVRQLIEDHVAAAAKAGNGATAPAAGKPDFQWLIEGLKRIDRGGSSFYTDRGYAKDPPVPVHSHYGYSANSTGSTCLGGGCGK